MNRIKNFIKWPPSIQPILNLLKNKHKHVHALWGIDEPRRVIDCDYLICNGWAYSKNGIDSIEIFLDGINMGKAKYGSGRDDLKITFPNHDGIENSGFHFYKHVSLNDGKHSLVAHILEKNGNRNITKTVNFSVNKSIAVIERLNIELTNFCNLNCRWCGCSGPREKGYMDFSLFKHIFDEITSNDVNVSEIHLYNQGESLLHPDFCAFLEYIGKIEKRPKCILVTNATLLDSRLTECIISSGGLDLIQFSVDGGTKKSFEWLRRGANWESTLNKISNFLDKNQGKVKTGFITIDLEQNLTYARRFKNLIERADYFDLRYAHDWTGYEKLDDFTIKREFNPYPCWSIRNNLVILWNGDVALCCADQYGRTVIGNVGKDRIANLWKGRRYDLFKMQSEGRKRDIKSCGKCSVF